MLQREEAFMGRFHINIFGILILFVSEIVAQHVSIKLEFDLQYLQAEAREIVADLQGRLEDYVSSYEFRQGKLDVFIPIKMNIIFESYSQSGGSTQFKAQFLISTPSGENFYDRNWQFTYNRGEILQHDLNQAHPITSLIDYYVFLALAGEMDTYALLGGTEYYETARNILGIARNLVNWNLRENEFNEIMDGRLLQLRELKYYYYQSLFLIDVGEGKDLERIRQNNREMMERLERVSQQFPSAKALKRFFDYHYQELCLLLSYDESPVHLLKLTELDPVHADSYTSCINEKF